MRRGRKRPERSVGWLGWHIDSMKRKVLKTFPNNDITTPEAYEMFRKAAEAFTARVTKSRATALAALVKEGIYTKDGKLTKNYGG